MKISSPLPATTSRGPVQQGLFARGGALGLFQFGRATDKRYSLGTTNHHKEKLMGMIKCNSCGTEISPKATTCPKCGHPNEKAKHFSGGQVLWSLAVAGGILWFFAGGGLEKQVAKDMQEIENQVATDAVNQYQMAKRQGDPIQICVQAGFVSAAYLQAKDEPNYQQWKKTQSEECRRAGLPQ